MKKFPVVFTIVVAAFSLIPFNYALAQLTNPLGTGSNNNSLYCFIFNVVGQAMVFGAVIAALFFVYSGFLFVKARGNPEELQKAKRTLLYTVIGAAILLGARVIATIIQNTINTLQGTSTQGATTCLYFYLKGIGRSLLG